ncbi:hypothetical protein FEM48_Zijuj04G0092400 [Ziziphus jujuba var. spinosa]|uniref:Uncharacterized protein n=1 Tax=Ziziphus jujuba var. spinosa TaxID=714518 RepID=A0A978VJ11_ZIZJJ|nr:hypothetical protein FEM48_Zijuj04G0092400 [Ziziphus jujuba var. spinosa]
MKRSTPRLEFARRKSLKTYETNSDEYVKGVNKAVIQRLQTDPQELTIHVPLKSGPDFSDDINRWCELGAKKKSEKAKIGIFFFFFSKTKQPQLLCDFSS